MASTSTTEESSMLYTFGLLGGGLTLGFGIVSLYWSFGVPGTAINQDFALVGFSAIDNLRLLDAADYSIGLVVLGVLIMVLLNAIAWKRTGGY